MCALTLKVPIALMGKWLTCLPLSDCLSLSVSLRVPLSECLARSASLGLPLSDCLSRSDSQSVFLQTVPLSKCLSLIASP